MNEWCPTIAGTYTAYEAEWFDEESGKWLRVETVRSPVGIPQPIMNGGINQTLGLLGYEQAMALAWMFAADRAAIKHFAPKVRVQPYEVHYDLKAKKTELSEKDG